MGKKNCCCLRTPTSDDEENATLIPQGEDVKDEAKLTALLEVKDVSNLDEVISFIEARLNAIPTDKVEESTSGAEHNATSGGVAFSINCGYYFIKNVLNRAHKQSSKILSGETRKAVIEILRGIGQTVGS